MHRIRVYGTNFVSEPVHLIETGAEKMSIDTGAGYGGNKIVCDMDEHGEMKRDAMSRAAMAIEQSTEEKAISRDIKGYMDQKYGPTWHCIVGSDFRAYVTHESKHFIFFYIGKTAICLYKAG